MYCNKCSVNHATLILSSITFFFHFRMNHKDVHYCAAFFRYLREFAILLKDRCTLVSSDDKHKVKVGEPSYPLAAVERGKQVIVGANQVMAVGDHDFSKVYNHSISAFIGEHK